MYGTKCCFGVEFLTENKPQKQQIDKLDGNDPQTPRQKICIKSSELTCWQVKNRKKTHPSALIELLSSNSSNSNTA